MKKIGAFLLVLALLASLALPALALTDAEVEAAARAHVPQSAVLRGVTMDDGLYEARFTVEATGERYEVKVHPDTGAVIKLESDLPNAHGSKVSALHAEQVTAAVQAAYPGAEVLRQDENIDDGWHEIEAFFRAEGLYGELDLNAETGEVLERKIHFGDYQANGLLTEEAVRAALASLKPDAVITRLELDEDDGRSEWEGKATLGGEKYEFTIDAATGELVEWERD